MTVEPWEPVARGTIPRAERFTVQEALDLTAGAVHPGWDEGDAVEPGVRFYATREEHLAELFEALIERRVKVLNPMTLMPLPSAVGEALERAIIMPGELVRFARECLGIELVREATEAAETAAEKPGTVKRWTPELVTEAWELRQRLERENVKAPMRETAKHFGVSPQALRAKFLEHGMRETSAAPLAQDWPPAKRRVYRRR